MDGGGLVEGRVASPYPLANPDNPTPTHTIHHRSPSPILITITISMIGITPYGARIIYADYILITYFPIYDYHLFIIIVIHIVIVTCATRSMLHGVRDGGWGSCMV